MKKLLSVFLAVVLLLTGVSIVSYAQDDYDLDYPVVYVIGRVYVFRDMGTPDEAQTPDASTDEIMDAVKECLPAAAKAYLLGGKYWDEYNEKTLPVLLKFFEGYSCDENGVPPANTGIKWSWSEQYITRDYQNRPITNYEFRHDPRISPYEAADQLHEYIEAIKRVTGKDKVCLIARCMGTNTMLAYLQKYPEPIDYAGVASVLFYTSASQSVPMLDAAFSGSIEIESKSAGYFLESLKLGEKVDNETLAEVIPYALDMLENSFGIKVTAAVVQRFYDKIKNTLIRDFLLGTLACSPGYWAMVGDSYDQAKKYLFGGEEEKYAGLIAKADEYHYNVYERTDEMIADMRSDGVKVSAVCKYGFPAYPLTADANKLSDGDTPVALQSFGATTSEYDTRLPDKYVKARTEAGFGDYISPDRQIDASTGLLPETTWYIKNYPHSYFPLNINAFLKEVLWRSDYTVASDEAHPQFMVMVEGNNIVPQTTENCNTAMVNPPEEEQGKVQAFFARIRAFFKAFFNLVKLLFAKKN